MKLTTLPTGSEVQNEWNCTYNDELDELIKHKNIINHIKTQKLSLFDMKKLKIKNQTSCILDYNKWKLYTEKAKTFKD